jgi:hypothetical protein
MRTLTLGIIRASFLAIFAVALWAADPGAVIGSVKSAEGTAVVHRGSQDIPSQEGMHLILDDVLRTSSDGRIGAMLQDGRTPLARIEYGSEDRRFCLSADTVEAPRPSKEPRFGAGGFDSAHFVLQLA